MAVTDWSTTAGSNTTLGALSTQGTAQANTIDDLFRELMAQVATFNTGATFGHTAQLSIGGNTPRIGAFGTTVATSGLALGAFNATAGNAAHLDFYRSKNAAIGSADVVASGDNLGAINWFGAQQTGTFATQTIAAQIRSEVDGVVSSGASGDMPGSLVFATTADGGSAVTDRVIIDSAGVFKPATNDGAALGKSGTAWSDAFFASGAVLNFAAADITVTHSTGILDFSAGIYRFQSPSSSTPGSGNNLSGLVIDSGGTIYASRGGQSAIFNRTSDGNLININSAGANQGIISVSGATVTYGAFFGSHWSQTADGSKPDILRGTIVDSLDQMCEWPGEGAEERLPCFKISDKAGSRAVYGVFAWWEIWDGDGEAPTNDAFIGSLGAFVIRVAPGIDVQRGDYIESNGDGCGRIQKDDILRASTVAKITSGIPVDTYPDGSRLFPCTLHCG